MYRLLRSFLFSMPPELAHHVSMGALDTLAAVAPRIGAPCFPGKPVKLWNLEFPNAVGLAAGLDKSGDHFDSLGRMGFGFIEIGTVTPRPQPGNPRPRLFRLEEHEALVNRMGFNNRGLDHLIERVRRRRYRGVLGINIGKNADTPVEHALDDYLACLERVYDLADYITVNVSSPNTEGLRSLQYGEELRKLLHSLKRRQAALGERSRRSVPLLVKLAPDLTDNELVAIAGIIRDAGIEGVVATNTTVMRETVAGHRHAGERGGLSGRPLAAMSTHVIAALHAELGASIPIVGVGGIFDAASAREKIQAGARLVQLYTGFIYRGPGLVADVARALAQPA